MPNWNLRILVESFVFVGFYVCVFITMVCFYLYPTWNHDKISPLSTTCKICHTRDQPIPHPNTAIFVPLSTKTKCVPLAIKTRFQLYQNLFHLRPIPFATKTKLVPLAIKPTFTTANFVPFCDQNSLSTASKCVTLATPILASNYFKICSTCDQSHLQPQINSSQSRSPVKLWLDKGIK